MEEILSAKVDKGQLGVWWIGQGGFVFKTGSGKIAMVDPYLSYSMENVTYIHDELAIPLDSVRVDYVFLSHDHTDHTDEPTLKGIAAADPEAKFYGPTSSVEKMIGFGIDPDRVGTIDRGEKIDLEAGISAEAVYAHHTPDSIGFILDLEGIAVYYTGDTEVGLDSYLNNMDRLKGLGPELMVVCINPGYNNLGPDDAARLVKFVEPKVVIPMHYDLIEENTVDPNLFLKALKRERASAKPVVMNYGGEYIWVKGE